MLMALLQIVLVFGLPGEVSLEIVASISWQSHFPEAIYAREAVEEGRRDGDDVVAVDVGDSTGPKTSFKECT